MLTVFVDVNLCMEAVVRIRVVITRDLTKLEDGYDRLLLVLAHTVSH